MDMFQQRTKICKSDTQMRPFHHLNLFRFDTMTIRNQIHTVLEKYTMGHRYQVKN